MSLSKQTRRTFLGSAAVSVAAAPTLLGGQARAHTPTDEGVTYEVTRSEAEWREMLSEDQYRIMREGATEPRFNSQLWEQMSAGHYHCRGCDLTLYGSDQKIMLLIGWVFFHHSHANAVLTSIDVVPAEYGDSLGESENMMEAHCRRCGSHLGHIISYEESPLHCINGASLVFHADA
ncbi:MAG: peptide-methionine (R)-S-oxide reductase [Rhodobacteraceae bacterium CG17_big_fil_post_rev_8_21_14_2_50_65_11]|nr:MAG: peptide-methionine (R)-S-oxide reductase [Rhodobacteraceae bacterium CG17_big_fil_post_rev_8_21_14_2_50_65_11]